MSSTKGGPPGVPPALEYSFCPKSTGRWANPNYFSGGPY